VPALKGPAPLVTSGDETWRANHDFLPNLSIYGGYSEANRAPTPLENGCADRNQPCLIDNFLVADPPLKQVVSRTVEAGIRGNFDVSLFGPGKINWNAGVFRTINKDDILNVPSTIAGRGFFENAGDTRRQGIEAGISAFCLGRLGLCAGLPSAPSARGSQWTKPPVTSPKISAL